jgi:purine-binding chemotaxis protein CheW
MDISKLRKKAKEQQAISEQPKEEKLSESLKEKQTVSTRIHEEASVEQIENAAETKTISDMQATDVSSSGKDIKPSEVTQSANEVQLLELTKEELKRQSVDVKEKELLCFKLEDEEYAIELGFVKEIIRAKDITPVPNTADFVLGITVLRGEIIPVIDLRKRIGLTPLGFTPSTRLIIVYFEGATTALVVDNIPDVKRVSTGSIQPADKVGSVDVRFLSGISTSNGGFTVLLKLEEILKQSDMLKV